MVKINYKQIEYINNYIIEKFNPKFIIMFGSAAKDKMRIDSDIDIAFLSSVQYEDYDVFMSAQEMAGELGYNIDLIQLSKASTVFKAQIISSGKVIFERNQLERMEFNMRSLKEYTLLNEERQGIIDKLYGGG